MKIILSIFVLFVLISGLTACASHSGNTKITDQSAIDKIKIGKSTKTEVRSILGKPNNIMRQSGKESWMYTYSKTNIGAKAFIPFANLVGESAVNIESSSLMVFFDKNGIVENIMSNVSAGN